LIANREDGKAEIAAMTPMTVFFFFFFFFLPLFASPTIEPLLLEHLARRGDLRTSSQNMVDDRLVLRAGRGCARGSRQRRGCEGEYSTPTHLLYVKNGLLGIFWE
jgi:hypothetical protein